MSTKQGRADIAEVASQEIKTVEFDSTSPTTGEYQLRQVTGNLSFCIDQNLQFPNWVLSHGYEFERGGTGKDTFTMRNNPLYERVLDVIRGLAEKNKVPPQWLDSGVGQPLVLDRYGIVLFGRIDRDGVKTNESFPIRKNLIRVCLLDALAKIMNLNPGLSPFEWLGCFRALEDEFPLLMNRTFRLGADPLQELINLSGQQDSSVLSLLAQRYLVTTNAVEVFRSAQKGPVPSCGISASA